MADLHTHGTRPTQARYIVLLLMCAAAVIAYFSRNILGVASDVIMEDLTLSRTEMSFIMGSFFFSYSLMQIPGALLGARFGSRRVLTTLAVIWGVGTAMMGASIGSWSILVAYLAIGLTQAGLFPCTTISFSHWLPAHRRGIGGGSLTSSMSVGGAVAAGLTGVLIGSLSWRWICVLFGAPALLWAWGFFVWFRDRPEEHSGVNDAELAVIRGDPEDASTTRTDVSDTKPATAPWGTLLTTPVMWLICGQQFFRAAGYIFFPTWFPKYLRETWGASTAESGFLSGIPFLAVVVGGVVGGVAVDWIYRTTGSRWLSRPGFALLSTLACALFFLSAYVSPSLTVAMIMIGAGAFCQAMAAPCTFAVTIEVGGSWLPKLYSSMNMSGNIGAWLCPLAVDQFVEFTNETWELVPVFFCGIYIASALCWIFINPNRGIGGSTPA